VATTVHTTNALTFPMDGSTVVWAAVPNGNQGDGVAEDWDTAHFQVTGTFGVGGSVQIEGSDDGVNWIKLTPAALTAAGIFAPLAVNERPKWLRPNVTAGDGSTALTVTGFLKKKRPGAV
jgi:hypothetical protein